MSNNQYPFTIFWWSYKQDQNNCKSDTAAEKFVTWYKATVVTKIIPNVRTFNLFLSTNLIFDKLSLFQLRASVIVSWGRKRSFSDFKYYFIYAEMWINTALMKTTSAGRGLAACHVSSGFKYDQSKKNIPISYQKKGERILLHLVYWKL